MEATTAAASSAASLSRPKLNQSITESNMSGQKQQNHTRLTNSTKCLQLHAYHMSSRPIHVCWTSWRRIWAHEIILSNVTYIAKRAQQPGIYQLASRLHLCGRRWVRSGFRMARAFIRNCPKWMFADYSKKSSRGHGGPGN